MNNFLIKNNRGTDKVISIYWFVVIVIIAGGVFAMVYSFYGAPYDVREIEGNVLADKIADCLSVQGKLNENLFNSNGEFDENFSLDFFKECNLNFNSESDYDWDKTIQYFSEINFYNVDDVENSVYLISKGNSNFRADCFIEDKKNKDYENLAKCVEKRFYAVDSVFGKQYLIKILVAVGKGEKNVKQWIKN